MEIHRKQFRSGASFHEKKKNTPPPKKNQTLFLFIRDWNTRSMNKSESSLAQTEGSSMCGINQSTQSHTKEDHHRDIACNSTGKGNRVSNGNTRSTESAI